MAQDDYVCSLCEKSIKKAKKELNEDPKERMGAVQAFREWILQQKHIKCPTDTLFLLRFLRWGKFSQLRAREKLENFIQCMQDFPEWCQNIDLHDPKIQYIYRMKYFTGIAEKDSNNRAIAIAVMGNSDFEGMKEKGIGSADMMKAMMGTILAAFYDEEQMVNGSINFTDNKGYSLKHTTFMSREEIKNSTRIWKDGFPSRIVGLHYYNVNQVFETMMALFKPLMPKKWIDRMKFHATMESVYKYVEKKCLPLEYLPDDYDGPNAGTLQEASDKFCERLSRPEIHERVLYLSNPNNFRIDKTEKDKVPQESFRKLNID